MKKETKNANPELYGYKHPWLISGNEGCGKNNPVNRNKPENEIPPYKVHFAIITDNYGNKRYFPCSKEQAQAINNLYRNEIRRKNTESRCLVPSDKYDLKTCRENCFCCPYKRDMKSGNPISIDKIREDYGYEPSSDSFEVFDDKLEDESIIAEIKVLAETLDEVDKTILDNMDKTNTYIAELTGTSKQVIAYRRKRLIGYLQKKIKNFF